MGTAKIPEVIQNKFHDLKAILKDMQKVLVAFSGGVDSTLLVKVAHDVLGNHVLAVIAKSETYPQTEIQEAIKLAQQMGVRYMVIESCEMEDPNFVSNSPERCYFCKMELFSKLQEIASNEGIPYILDGANLEDADDYRPGFKAANELGIRSPLKEAQLIKNEIRTLSRCLGLPTWDKPSLACLSSRFPYYTTINSKALNQVAQAEDFLRSLGFSQIRVRHHDHMARIEVLPEEISRLTAPDIREQIIKSFKDIGYTYVTLDMAGYRTGSLNETLSLDKKEQGKNRGEKG
jgi:uncharacterized protein